jgi:hypothetical protein
MKTKMEQIREFSEINEIAQRILDREQEFIDELLDETAKSQPLMASSMMYFAEDMETKEAADVVSLFLVVWGIYRRFEACHRTPVTSKQFAGEQEKTFSMFNFLAGEDDTSMFEVIARDDYEGRTVPSMPGYIHHCFKTWPTLKYMNIQQNALVNMSLKTFTDCFEQIIVRSREKRA